MAKYITCGEIFLNDNRAVVALVSITINVLISQQNENIWHEKYE